MANIKSGLHGVVHARDKAGQLVILRSGDAVPQGVVVRPELLADVTPKGGTSGKSSGRATK